MDPEFNFEITSIRLRHVDSPEEHLRAIASIAVNGLFTILNLKVIEGTTATMRAELERVVIAAYREEQWRPPEGSGVIAWVRPPPDDLDGRAARVLPRGPSASHGAV